METQACLGFPFYIILLIYALYTQFISLDPHHLFHIVGPFLLCSGGEKKLWLARLVRAVSLDMKALMTQNEIKTIMRGNGSLL